MPRRLKTFRAHLGFFDTVVAAPSQKAALQAWGSRQDLFKDGTAALTDDPAAVKAANAKPGVVLKRAVGSNGPYSEAPSLPHVKSVAKPSRAAPPAPPKLRVVAGGRAAPKEKPERPSPRPAPPPPDRGALDRAEEALKALKKERERSRRDFAERREALAADEARAMRDLEAQEKKLAAAWEREKRAYRQAVRDRRK